MRFIPIQPPLNAPYFKIDWAVYSLQLGIKRQDGGKAFESVR